MINKSIKNLKNLFSFFLILSIFLINVDVSSSAVLFTEKSDFYFGKIKIDTQPRRKKEKSITIEEFLVDSNINKQLGIIKNENKIKTLENFKQTRKQEKDYVEGEILVKYKDNKVDLQTVSGRAIADSFIRSKAMEKKQDLKNVNVSVLKIKDGKTVEEKIAELKNDTNVQYAEPNYIYPWSSIYPDDTDFSLQWALNNATTSTADISAPEAWDITTGADTVIVAILDSGIAYNHPDLKNNMWDDSQGCKNENDQTITCPNHGWDFVTPDNDPLDDHSHGTHVAGIIGAEGNNSNGIAGVNWNVKLMALKVGDYKGAISDDVIAAIQFAINNGVKIINASFSGNSFSIIQYEVINDFRESGGIFVTAAGNELNNNDAGIDKYPCNYDLDNIICVAATDQNDNLAIFSNYGATSVDVGAPGTNIYSTMPEETIVLFEDFEGVTPPKVPTGFVPTGDWGTYDLGDVFWGKVLYGDAHNIPYAQTANSTITSPAYNLNAGGANINFWTKCDTEYSTTIWTDYMALEYSNDGGSSFTEILKWDEPYLDYLNGDSNPTGGAVVNFSGSIPSQYLTSNFKLRFRWVANGNMNTGDGDGCLVDDIKITKYSDGLDEKYDYMSGTSMAAPHVAGLAGLIWGYDSGLNYLEVKDAILNTGDDLSSLLDKTSTGKRINAANALNSIISPVISDLQTASTTATSTIVNWTTDESATSKVAYSTSTPVESTIVSSSTLATIHSLELTNLTASTTYYYYVESADEYGNIATSTERSFITNSEADTTPPIVTSFTIPETSDSLEVSIDSFEATDNVEVTGYLLTQTSTAPLADDSDWSVATSTSYIFSSEGIQALYAWAKDASNNISTSSNDSVVITLPDTTAPILFEVTAIATSTNDNTPDYTFNSDEAGDIAYGGLCSSSSTTALAENNTITFNKLIDGTYSDCTIIVTDAALNTSDSLQVSTFTIDTVPPITTLIGSSTIDIYVGDSYTDARATALDDVDGDITEYITTINPVDTSTVGTYIITYNVSDAAGNSADQVIRTVIVSDNESPIITSFTIPETSDSLKVSIDSFEATDNVKVTGYLLTETSTVPLVDDSNWSVATSTSYTFSSEGPQTLYAWAKDASNNISTSTNDSVVITFRNITEVSSLGDINEIYGTLFASLSLPETVEVTLTDTSTTTLQVTWIEGTYDGNVAGEYILEGDITLTSEISNSDNLQASVKVVVAKNTAKAITSFKIESLSPEVTGVINETDHTILLTVPYGTDVTNLVPTILISDHATSTPVSGIAQDFTNPITYTVTAENASSTQDYIATVLSGTPPTTTTTTSAGGGGGGGGSYTPPTTTTTTTAGIVAAATTQKSDINGDNKVDKYDFSLMMANWEKIGSNNCDLNDDGKVNKYDFALLMLNWGV